MKNVIIYKSNEGGVTIVIPAIDSGLTIEEIAVKDVPQGTDFEIIDISEIPTDRTFRNAWEKNGSSIVHNMNKVKSIAHGKRREMRAKEFAPLDIEATIPAKAQQAEAAREAIRQKYATMQEKIDSATNADEVKNILEGKS